MLVCCPTAAPKKSGSTTPTMGNGLPSTWIVFPTTSAAPPYSLSQKLALITATAGHSRKSSVCESRRPAAGCTPSIGKKSPLTQLDGTGRASPPFARLNVEMLYAAAPEKTSCRSRIASHSGFVKVFPLPARVTRMSSSGWLTGSDLKSTALISVKIAVLAPIPRPSDSTATIANAGVARNARNVYRRSVAMVYRSAKRSRSRTLLLRTVVAEAALRLVACCAESHPARHEIVGSLGDVEVHLAVDVAREVIRAKEIADSAEPGHETPLSDRESGRTKDALHAFTQARPTLFFHFELFLARGRDGIEPRLAILLRRSPLGAQPAVLRHAVKCGIQRPFLDAQQLGGHTLDVRRDGVAVHASLRREGLEDEQRERALEDVVLWL